MKKILFLLAFFLFTNALLLQAQKINYITEFENENHPEIGYWFISSNIITEDKKYREHIDSIAKNCKYTLIFLTARDGISFYDFEKMHPVFRDIVAAAHKRGIKVGLQLWGNYKDKTIDGSQRMIIETELPLDANGNASATVKAKYIRFPDRLLKSDLFKVYAFKKTGEGFYDPSTLKDITRQCEAVLPNNETVEVKIKGDASLKGLTACIMTQEYCSQSSNWDDVEINGFAEAMKIYSDVPFDGFALDEYGNKFVERIMDPNAANPFRGRWYSTAMAAAYQKETGNSLENTLFNGRYAAEGKPEEMVEKIAAGKLNKFYKESTLLNQEYIKDNKMSIRQYLQSINKDLTVTGFKRFSLS